MSLNQRKAAAAIIQDSINNPPTHIVERVAYYNVSPGASPTFIAFSGSVSRLTIQHNTGGIGIGDIPFRVTVPYRRIGNPPFELRVGIRKAIDDSFTLIAEWPVSEPRHSSIAS